MPDRKHRLITRSDFDGLVCAVLLKELDLISTIDFVHPKDMQDGIIDINGDEITTNLPYVEGVYLAFDHHYSETLRVGDRDNRIINPDAPSAARLVYDYYGGKETFPNISETMMAAVDKADSADFTPEDIINPEKWMLLNFLMDSRTGLGRFKGFKISNYQFLMNLIDMCRTLSIDEIMEDPDVQERIDMYFKHQEDFKKQLIECTEIKDNIAVIDLREEEIIYTGNRFMIYALYPEVNVSMHVFWRKELERIVFAVGHSILNRTCKTNVGELMLSYGGGGHKAAGTCQIEPDRAEDIKQELVGIISANG